MIRQIMQMAMDSEGNPRHIDDVDNGVKCKCFCPACGHPLVAKNEGEIRAHHYSHLSNVDCEHGYQSSIHLMAKIIFLEMKEEIMEILTGVRSDVDFENSTKLIDDGILESLDIVAIVGEFNETFDVEISVEDLVPENFNSVDAMVELITRAQE